MAKAVRLKAKSVEDCVRYPIADLDREKAWDRLIRSRHGKNLRDHGFPKDELGFRFPLGGCYYELWCIAWEFARDAGWRKRMEVEVKNDSLKKGKKVR